MNNIIDMFILQIPINPLQTRIECTNIWLTDVNSIVQEPSKYKSSFSNTNTPGCTNKQMLSNFLFMDNQTWKIEKQAMFTQCILSLCT